MKRRMKPAFTPWAAMRAQRAKRSGRAVFGWTRLVRDACRAASRQDAHAVAAAEILVGFLHHRDVLAGIEQHGQLDAGALVGASLDALADDAAQDRAADGARHLPAAAAYIAARDAAEHRAAGSADARLVRVHAHGADRIDHPETHPLLTARLIAAIVARAVVVSASAEHERARRRRTQGLQKVHPSLLDSLDCLAERLAKSLRDGLTRGTVILAVSMGDLERASERR